MTETFLMEIIPLWGTAKPFLFPKRRGFKGVYTQNNKAIKRTTEAYIHVIYLGDLYTFQKLPEEL